MDGAFWRALTMMGIALPTMFLVIIVFMLATKALHRAFPGSDDDDE